MLLKTEYYGLIFLYLDVSSISNISIFLYHQSAVHFLYMYSIAVPKSNFLPSMPFFGLSICSCFSSLYLVAACFLLDQQH